jgi:hypothetical protein
MESVTTDFQDIYLYYDMSSLLLFVNKFQNAIHYAYWSVVMR